MLELIHGNGPAFLGALVLVLLVGWWLLRRGGSTPRRTHRPDVLDEGAAPAQRNQALIDAPAAAIVPPAMAGAMAGLGEIIAVAAQDEVAEAAAAGDVAGEAGPATADDLTRIKGLGPKLRTLLATLGVTTFAQIAAMNDADLDELDARLGTFAGRPRRDSWVAQARFLAAGDVAGFEGQFGKL